LVWRGHGLQRLLSVESRQLGAHGVGVAVLLSTVAVGCSVALAGTAVGSSVRVGATGSVARANSPNPPLSAKPTPPSAPAAAQ
jgi:hypothetical protein